MFGPITKTESFIMKTVVAVGLIGTAALAIGAIGGTGYILYLGLVAL